MNVDNVTVISKAEVAENQSPIKPAPMLNIAIAFIVGLMASVGLAFLLEYLDNTVKKRRCRKFTWFTSIRYCSSYG